MKYTEKLICFLGLLHLSPRQASTETKTCVLGGLEKTVTFSSLLEFQNPAHSFNASGYQGSTVNFNFKSIDRLERNAFISFGSDSIIKIALNNKGIKTIDDGAFNGLFCLHSLNLEGNNISSFPEYAFQGLENLRELNLSRNLFETIFDNGFILGHLQNLKILDLSRNKIRSLYSSAFFNLTNLERLDLGFNKIRSFSPNIFTSLENLRELYINNNYLQDIEPHKWNSLHNLTVLDLAYNSLAKFDPAFNFSFWALQKLNLSGNYLSSLNSFELRRNLVKLELIDIRENNWSCDELYHVKHQLRDSRITLLADVNCSSSGEYKRPTTEIIIVSPTPNFITNWTTRATAKTVDYSKEIYEQNGDILLTTKKIFDNVQHLQAVVVYLFVVIILCIVIYMFVRIGFFQNLYNIIKAGNCRHSDRNDREHVVLMRS